MSPPAATSSPNQDKAKKGIGKLLSRARTVFRKESTSRRSSQRLATAPQAEASTSTPITAPAQATTENVAGPETETAPKDREIPDGAVKVSRSQIQEERAKRLGLRFGIDFNPNEWSTGEAEVLRVDKAPRMRIHRQCHKCQTGFGANKQCPNCHHARCKKCTRNPPRMTDVEREAARARKAELARQRKENAPIIPSYDYSQSAAEIVLKRPKRTGNQDLVFRAPRVRVRRYCHLCNLLMNGATKDSRTCAGCGHKRCDDCPRQPDARKKYPYGYPGDEPGEKFVPTHRCHECRTKFPRGTEDGAECAKCAHKKCTECPKIKPRKVDPKLSPESMEMLQARIMAMSIGSDV